MKIPLPLAGVMLAIATLGNIMGDNIIFHYLCFCIAIVLWLIITYKIIFRIKETKNDLKNINILSTFPTYTMGSMVLTTYFSTYIISRYLWVMFLLIQMCIMGYFIYKYIIKSFSIASVTPAWFVMFVGICVGAVTSSAHNMEDIGQVLVQYSFIVFIILFALITFRIYKYEKLEDHIYPTLAIYSAPLNLILCGYLKTYTTINIDIVAISYMIGMLIYVIVVSKIVVRVLKNKFYPSVSATTFPLVVSAFATSLMPTDRAILDYVLLIQVIIAILVISYVLYLYFNNFVLVHKIKKEVQSK